MFTQKQMTIKDVGIFIYFSVSFLGSFDLFFYVSFDHFIFYLKFWRRLWF